MISCSSVKHTEYLSQRLRPRVLPPPVAHYKNCGAWRGENTVAQAASLGEDAGASSLFLKPFCAPMAEVRSLGMKQFHFIMLALRGGGTDTMKVLQNVVTNHAVLREMLGTMEAEGLI